MCFGRWISLLAIASIVTLNQASAQIYRRPVEAVDEFTVMVGNAFFDQTLALAWSARSI